MHPAIGNSRLFALLAAGWWFDGGDLQAQQAREPLAATVTPTPAAATASLEERIAAARSVKVIDSILGIILGSELDAAHEKLDPMCAPGTHPKEEGNEGEEAARRENEKASEGGASGTKTKPGADEGEGHKVLWQLAGTDYSAVYITADEHERILSITGILRPGKEMPFDQVGEVAKAPVHDEQAVVWDVLRPGRPLCRVLAKGVRGRASTIMLFVAARPSVLGSHRSAEANGNKGD